MQKYLDLCKLLFTFDLKLCFMNDKMLAHYLHSLSEGELHEELLKYKTAIKENTIKTCYRRWIVFQKKRRDLEQRRINTGYMCCENNGVLFKVSGWDKMLDYINAKIAGGSL